MLFGCETRSAVEEGDESTSDERLRFMAIATVYWLLDTPSFDLIEG